MKWSDLCAKLGMPETLSFNIIPSGERIVSCYYIEEVLCAWWNDYESVYSLEDDSHETTTISTSGLSTEDERFLDEDYDY